MLIRFTKTIEKNLNRQLARGKISEEEKNSAVEKIKVTLSYDELTSCDLVIEASTEKEEIKQKIFAELCSNLKKESLIAKGRLI